MATREQEITEIGQTSINQSRRVTPSVGNAACNAGGKLLKIVEMQYRYGTSGAGQGEKVLSLVPSSDEIN